MRLLTPFDPVVWDRARFERLWGWTYRFEAYTPVAKRKRGYYALPILWRDRVIGWGNLSVKDGALRSEFGYVKSQPHDRTFKRELALKTLKQKRADAETGRTKAETDRADKEAQRAKEAERAKVLSPGEPGPATAAEQKPTMESVFGPSEPEPVSAEAPLTAAQVFGEPTTPAAEPEKAEQPAE